MHAFTLGGCRLLTPLRIVENGMVSIRDGIIEYAGPWDSSRTAGTVRDVGGQYVSPGWIDLHTHGAGGADFMDGTEEAFCRAAAMHASHGTAVLLPTTLACSDEELLNVFAVFRQVKRRREAAVQMPGLHLEGPFFAQSQRGAQDPRYVTPPQKERYEKILAAGDGLILRWSSAPELPGAMEFSRLLRRRGIVSAIAHSDATDQVVCQAIENGYTHITHLYSGMSGLVRIHSYRYPGVIESAFLFEELTSEIIADGCHLPASLLRYCYRTLGAGRLAVVTDSMRGAGMPDGRSILGSRKDGQECVIEDGVAKLPDRSAFAGSVATADRLVRNMRDLAGAPITDAVKMITLTPARIMGFGTKGLLAPGMDADLTVFDEDVRVSCTVAGGETVFSAF